jgi:diguanylate cyclase (GGDEF)-like protein
MRPGPLNTRANPPMTRLVDRALAPVLRLLPSAEDAGLRRRRAAGAVAAVLLLSFAVHVTYAAVGTGGSELADLLVNRVARQIVYLAAVVLCALRVRRDDPDRGAWLSLAIGLALWVAGQSYWNAFLAAAEDPPIPSFADAGWLAFYPFAYLSLGLHVRRTVRGVPASMWLDGLVGVLAVAAVGIAVVVAPIVHDMGGSTAELVVNAAYPIGDVLLVALVIAFVCLGGGGRGAAWMLLGLGFALFAAADSAYLLMIANGVTESSPALSSVWLAGITTMALAVWQPGATRAKRPADWRILALPFCASSAALGLLLYAGLRSTPAIAVCFAVAAMVTAMARTTVSVYELRRFAETRRQAKTDELTGLPNRRWFDQELRRAIAHARGAGDTLALLVIDLDHFKELNDTLGHHAGDRVLAQLGPRIRTALRTGDHVARLGGDEFAVLLPGAGAVEGAGERIADALSERFTVEGIELQIAASIGVALFPDHGDDAETLLQRADVAMYQAKTRRTGTEFYARERDLHTRERLQLIGELRDAVALETLTLHYQPKLDVGRNRIIGVEALVRWPHPEHGMVPPDEFIPLAEQTGVIGPLSELVIRKALRQAADWTARGIVLTMAVNVSATNLLEDGWTEGVLAALEHHGVRTDRFVVEITEDVLMTDPDRSLTALAALSAAGVRVSLDDFGTGYSSLSYLSRLPVDELKIDRSFVFGMATDQADAAIVQTVVDLGRRLGVGVAAEGVEDAATLRRLTDYGAGVAQGYHIARPMPAEELEAWLAAGGFVLRMHDEDVERARPVDALHAVELDVAGRRRA